MENLNHPLDSGFDDAKSSGSGLVISEPVRSAWRETSGWALFFAILTFIMLSFMLVMSLVAGSQSALAMAGMVPVLLFSLLFFFPGWFLYKFANEVRVGLPLSDYGRVTEGFSNLRKFYRFLGIVLIVIVGFYGIILLFSLLFAGAAAM